MELLQLRYFYTVGKMLNISQAARVHYIPQPAMSKTISKLETELDTKLFEREKNHLSLTPAGKSFLSCVEKMFIHLDQGIQTLNTQKDNYKGRINLLICQHRVPMADVVAKFTKEYPNVIFNISHIEDEDMRYDICISEHEPKQKFDSNRLLMYERINLLVPANHPFSPGVEITIADLKDELFIIHDQKGNLPSQVSKICEDIGFTPQKSVICNDLYCLKKYLILGLGVVFFPTNSWQHLLDNQVKEIKINPPIYRNVNIFWNLYSSKGNLTSSLVQEIISYFEQNT